MADESKGRQLPAAKFDWFAVACEDIRRSRVRAAVNNVDVPDREKAQAKLQSYAEALLRGYHYSGVAVFGVRPKQDLCGLYLQDGEMCPFCDYGLPADIVFAPGPAIRSLSV